MTQETNPLLERFYLMGLATFFLAIATFIAYTRGFFFLEKPWVRKGSFTVTASAFAIYFFCSLFLQNLIFWILKSFFVETEFVLLAATNFLGMTINFLVLSAFSLEGEKRGISSWGKGNLQDIWIGISVWGFAFPLAIVLGQMVSISVQFLFHQSYISIDQVAVGYIKSLLPYPILLSLNTTAIFLFVPITEEILFRGFFQTWLRGYLKPKYAILITALFFSGMHYSSSQGIANGELLTSLFVLGILLGYLYERQKTLLAPIGLHCFFNFVTLCLILVS